MTIKSSSIVILSGFLEIYKYRLHHHILSTYHYKWCTVFPLQHMECKREIRLTFFGSGTAIGICISAICYAIVMGVGWSLQRMASNEQLITTGAILTTIPIVFTVSYLLFTFRFLESCSESCSGDICLKDCTKTVVFITQLLAGILEICGGALFMAGSVNRRNQENVLAFGISAGVFAIISGLTCICAHFFFCFCTYNSN